VADSNEQKVDFSEFALELVVYAGFVFAYFFAVLLLLADRVKELFDDSPATYAVVALGLIVVQGAALEWLTRMLVKLIRRIRK
jgi:divalent metal cation (Fe/Co/Zn/Cd) transporter